MNLIHLDRMIIILGTLVNNIPNVFMDHTHSYSDNYNEDISLNTAPKAQNNDLLRVPPKNYRLRDRLRWEEHLRQKTT